MSTRLPVLALVTLFACSESVIPHAWADGMHPYRGSDVVVLFPDAPPDLLLEDLERTVTPMPTGSAPALSVRDSGLAEIWQRSQIPARKTAEALDEAQCRASASSVSGLMAQAEEQLNFLDYRRAGDLLKQAQITLSCGEETLSREQWRRWLLSLDMVRLSSGVEGSLLFREALTIRRNDEERGLPIAVRSAMKLAEKQLSRTSDVPVDLELEGLAGLTLRVDGLQPVSPHMRLAEGRHLLQLVGPDGRAVTGAIVTLASGSREPVVWPQFDLRPPPPEAWLAQLRQEIAKSKADASTRSFLQRWLRERGFRRALLVTSGRRSCSARVVRIDLGGAFEVRSLATPSCRQQRGAYVTAGAGLATLVAAGLYGYALREAKTGDWTSQSGQGQYEPTRELGVWSGSLGLAGLSATTLSAIWTWLLPQYHHPPGERRNSAVVAAPTRGSDSP